MAMMVRIGGLYLNLDQISHVEVEDYGESGVVICATESGSGDARKTWRLRGDEARAFIRWLKAFSVNVGLEA